MDLLCNLSSTILRISFNLFFIFGIPSRKFLAPPLHGWMDSSTWERILENTRHETRLCFGLGPNWNGEAPTSTKLQKMLDEPNSIDFLMEAHDGNLTMQKAQPCDLNKWAFHNHRTQCKTKTFRNVVLPFFSADTHCVQTALRSQCQQHFHLIQQVVKYLRVTDSHVL